MVGWCPAWIVTCELCGAEAVIRPDAPLPRGAGVWSSHFKLCAARFIALQQGWKGGQGSATTWRCPECYARRKQDLAGASSEKRRAIAANGKRLAPILREGR